jgi:hypothetical protein
VIVSIMQPYFFPYLGYFQLVHAADAFVAYDTAQYSRGGWINRNRILGADGPAWFTLPVAHDDISLPIDQRHYADPGGDARQRLLRKLDNQYRRAPRFRAAMDLLEPLLLNRETNVAAYNLHALRGVCAHLGITTRIEPASALPPTAGLRGTDAVLGLCRQFGADTYVNSIGGTGLYSPEAFARQGLALRFLRSEATPYPQFGGEPVAALSIIDVLMFNDPARIATMLGQYRLVEG